VNHQASNIFVYAPLVHTLMLVDVMFPDWVPSRGFASFENIRAGSRHTIRSSRMTSINS
jgi:hypothetical protein